MPKKIRQLIAELEKAGFINRGGKGSHRNYELGNLRVTVSGNPGHDAHRYQEKSVREAIAAAKKKEQP